jgi:hypothetical protein
MIVRVAYGASHGGQHELSPEGEQSRRASHVIFAWNPRSLPDGEGGARYIVYGHSIKPGHNDAYIDSGHVVRTLYISRKIPYLWRLISGGLTPRL